MAFLLNRAVSGQAEDTAFSAAFRSALHLHAFLASPVGYSGRVRYIAVAGPEKANPSGEERFSRGAFAETASPPRYPAGQ
jgi:hypothetical protein